MEVLSEMFLRLCHRGVSTAISTAQSVVMTWSRKPVLKGSGY